MIVLFTDYGQSGLYVGQLHTVIQQYAPGTHVIDLIHSLPRFNIQSAAYLLPAYTKSLPNGTVIVCVVDPGVGGNRPHAVVRADGCFYVGPDNGIFDVLVQQASQYTVFHIDWPLPVSNTFHGRDVYAPVASKIHQSGNLDSLYCKVAVHRPTRLAGDLAEIIYIDSYGNAMTGMRVSMLKSGVRLSVDGHSLPRASTFSNVPIGECFWYENSNGLIEIAANQASAAEIFDLDIGVKVSIRN